MEPTTVVSEPRPARARLLSALLLAVVLLSLLGAVYAIGFYAGPYRWLAELQLRHLGSYGVTVSVALTVLLCMLPSVVTIRVLAMKGTLPADGLAVALVSPGRNAALGARMGRARRWLIMAMLGVVLGGLSVRDLVVAERGKTLQQLSVAALEQGAVPSSSWLQVNETPAWDASLETKEDRKEWTYVPVLSADWTEGAKVGLLLRMPTREVEEWAAKPLQGTLDMIGVPGMVRSAYEESGLDVTDAVLLELGESPAERAVAAKIILPIGLVLFLLGAAGTYLRLRR